MEGNTTVKVVTIVGARPQFIKASAVSRAIEEYNRKRPEDVISEVILHTGQHYDENMSKIFFDELKMREPDYNLGIGSATHGAQTGRMLEAIEDVLIKEAPDWVMVYGDTNSTLAGSLAAKKLGIKVAHVEAGLRSFNMTMPEEINRIITDRISDLLFCPTMTAVKNLENEGFRNIGRSGVLVENADSLGPRPLVINVGDVMLDASIYFKALARKESDILKKLGLKKKSYALVTVHRAENTDDRMRLGGIIKGLVAIAGKLPVVFPVHPRTKDALKREGFESILKDCKNVHLSPPLSYLDMVSLEEAAQVIVTDSGGVQKEAFFYGVPCITVRDETEWVETVAAGWNTLAGVDANKIVEAFKKIEYIKKRTKEKFYGNGRAAKTIVECIKGIR